LEIGEKCGKRRKENGGVAMSGSEIII